MEHPVIVPFILVFVGVLIGAMMDAWHFKAHYVGTFPIVIATVAYLSTSEGLRDGGAALQDSLVIGFVGTGILILFFAVGDLTSRRRESGVGELEHPHL